MKIDFLLHPPVVHFPIAFYFLELLLLVFWAMKKDPTYKRFALFSFRLGYLFMLAALVAGYIDAGGLVPAVQAHFLAAMSVVVFYTVRAFFWRFGNENLKIYGAFQVGGALLGNALVGWTAFLGGKLAFG